MTDECRVCLCKHDELIHEATLRVRAWFREQVTMDRSVKPGKRSNHGPDIARRIRMGIPVAITPSEKATAADGR